MRTLLTLALLGPFCSCMNERSAEGTAAAPLPARTVGVPEDPSEVDVIQRTCALYVAVRSGALEVPVAFGHDLEKTSIHWNMCPGGTMVACVPAPTTNSDTAWTGIPWPY